MRLTTKLSAFMTLLTGLAIFVTLIGCSLSFFNATHDKVHQRMLAVATIIDSELITSSPEKLSARLNDVMVPVDISEISLKMGETVVYTQALAKSYEPQSTDYGAQQTTVKLMKHPGMSVTLTYRDPVASYYHSLFTTVPLSIAIGLMLIVLFLAMRWVKNQLAGQELLENRATRILNGERNADVRGSVLEWPARASSAMDMLLSDLQNASEQRSRMDTLIRAFAAQDGKTGLNNRLFFDNQLAMLLEDHEQVGAHGVVMIIRLPDFETLHDTWGHAAVEEYLFTLINLLSTFVMRYPGALLARYFRSDFAVLLPHRTLKEADSFASQLLTAVDSLPPTRILDRNDMLHIGICAWRSGHTKEQVMENAEVATRNASLQGANSWSVYDDKLPEKGRGNVKWRTLIEQSLQRGGPRFYHKPAVTRSGNVHHREIMCRIFDGNEEVLSAEYMPMVKQFGLFEQYDRKIITRTLPLVGFWPEETLAIQITVDALIRVPFQRWLRDTLMQCEKSLRSRIIFELAEADVCQHISRLQPVIRLIKALGSRIAIVQAGLTVVSTSYIKDLNAELIKLHPGLVLNIEKRTENQLFVQSLVEACHGTQTQVFATGVRTRGEWQTLIEKGVSGAQGEFFAASAPLDSNVKKYSQRYSV
ncbi:RNase E specificity factor CsrD [Enterobacteriaceae bacterium H11S18]|uniref:RNase E specificity factor CsrD n=1 Tax=Dryocola clanedunensis TaxID=2925396 RepID=UPI0022F13CAC|nr:RNase E specificity factor CsrD [Dryocola clanedunensis]MCT4705488.1 RNase E specificity factor CsrD [Dryocola clanedunensis]MCT4710062.1 RNase E specificity factor CsrD [Dryocola clanedunensis]